MYASDLVEVCYFEFEILSKILSKKLNYIKNKKNRLHHVILFSNEIGIVTTWFPI